MLSLCYTFLVFYYSSSRDRGMLSYAVLEWEVYMGNFVENSCLESNIDQTNGSHLQGAWGNEI